MNAENQDTPIPIEIPEDAIIVTQSHWAWLWSTSPWIILFGVSILVDFFTFGILPIILACVTIVPRYLSFRRTCYILTDESIIIQQGMVFGQHTGQIMFSDLSQLVIKPGVFGRTLGYAGVGLLLKDGQMGTLQYVPAKSTLFEHIESRISR